MVIGGQSSEGTDPCSSVMESSSIAVIFPSAMCTSGADDDSAGGGARHPGEGPEELLPGLGDGGAVHAQPVHGAHPVAGAMHPLAECPTTCAWSTPR